MSKRGGKGFTGNVVSGGSFSSRSYAGMKAGVLPSTQKTMVSGFELQGIAHYSVVKETFPACDVIPMVPYSFNSSKETLIYFDFPDLSGIGSAHG